jgi:D-alanyl-D-alanine dipeptidase
MFAPGMSLALWLLGAASLQAPAPLVDMAKKDPRLHFDMRYASPHNFAKKQLYQEARCWLQPEVARRLMRAQSHLQARHPNLRLLLKDCYRPLRAQVLLYAAVKESPLQDYVAAPHGRHGSVHTYGAAVDVTLCTAHGKELDMGTPHDDLRALSQPQLEKEFLEKGVLKPQHLRNRKILREAMLRGGHFRPIRREWWHFDAWQGQALRARYAPLDLPI